MASLEVNADRAVRSDRNLVVVADLVRERRSFAQRACFLPKPVPSHAEMILAISFKRDAAKTLAERVKKDAEMTRTRFHSMTYDAFAKGLVDRFRSVLEEYRPSADYEVVTNHRHLETEEMVVTSQLKSTGTIARTIVEDQARNRCRLGERHGRSPHSYHC